MTTTVELSKVKRAYYTARELGLTVKVDDNELFLNFNGMEIQIAQKQINKWSLQYDTLIEECFKDSNIHLDEMCDEKKLYGWISRAVKK